MVFKILASIIAALLLLIFIGPVVVKLKDIALTVVVLVGVVMMVTDIWNSFQSRDE